MKTALLLPVALCLLAAPAFADGLTLAVVAPVEGPLAILGRQILDGARFAAEANGDRITVVPEACDEEKDSGLAAQIRAAGADAAIGFLCTEGLAHALPALAEAKVPAITLSVRSGILMEDALKKGWPLFRMAPDPKAEATRAIEVIARDWAAEPFALIDDGTIHARELVEAIRLRLEERGLKATFVDTFRPGQEQQIALVRRLAKTGVTRVFIGGDRADTAVIARDAAAEKSRLRLLGSEALMAPDQGVPLADGVEAIALPDHATLPEGEAVARAMRESRIVAEGYVLPAHAAATLIAEAAAKGGDLVEAIAGGRFETAIGPVAFDADHELRDNPYRLLQWRGTAFVPVDDRPEDTP